MENTIIERAVRILDTHKAADIKLLRVTGLTSITDYFLIATGTGATQVRSLADYLEDELRRDGIVPRGSEGYRTGDWITLDYGDMLVHLFRRQEREFYDLERLWSDAQTVDIAPWIDREGEINDETV